MRKYDFVALLNVKNCNPNGDPLNEGKPRTNLEGYGEISAECIKRKLRNRLQDMGESIFVQSQDRCDDGYDSLHARAADVLKNEFKDGAADKITAAACEKWIDVRLFGNLFAYSGSKISVGIRSAVTIEHTTSTDVVEIKDIQITKSVNGKSTKNGKRASDTMGMKSIVGDAVYVLRGSINPIRAEKNHVTEKDIALFKKALCSLFENDESCARPAGSMDVKQVYWFTQDETDYISSAKIFNLVDIDRNGNVTLKEIPQSVTLEELV